MTPRDILVIWGPTEQRPRELSRGGHVLGLGSGGDRGRLHGLFTRESSKQESGLDLPDGDLVTLVFRSKLSRVLRSVLVLGRLGDDRVGGPGHKVLFAGREVEELDTRVGESVRDGVFERLAGPKSDTDSVERGQVSSLGRPRDVKLSPSLQESAKTSSYERFRLDPSQSYRILHSQARPEQPAPMNLPVRSS